MRRTNETLQCRKCKGIIQKGENWQCHNKLKLKEDKLEKQVKPINGKDKETQELVLKLVTETLTKICRLNCYTDKIKSVFFISCDNREWRQTWTEERSLNAKIWNPSSSKQWHRNFRGREDIGFHEDRVTRGHGGKRQYFHHVSKI